MTRYIRAIIIAIAALACTPGSRALPTTAYPTRSPLASGLWVRVTTDREGIFQITYDQLLAMGFASPENVRVWCADPYELSTHTFTEELAGGMSAVAQMHTTDGRLLFYGQGEARISVNTTCTRTSGGFSYDRNYYDRSTSYLLSDAATAPDMTVAEWFSPTKRTPLTSHLHTELSEEELIRTVAGGVLAQGRKYSDGDLIPFRFRVKNWESCPTDTLALFRYVVDVAATSSSRMSVICPENVRRVTGSNLSATNVEFPDAFSACEGWMLFGPQFGKTYTDDEVTIEVQVPTGRDYSLVAADRGMLAYPRANRFDDEDPSLVMVLGDHNNSSGQEIRFPGASADMRLWLIDKPRGAVDVTAQTSDENETEPYVTFTLPRTCTRAVAFEPGRRFPEPKVIGAVPNSNLAGQPVPDMLIVTTDALREEAERLAGMHRTNQGMDVLVVTQKQINNEFCSGAPHVMGTRLLAKMLYDRDPAKFRYVLLFGPSFNDGRGIETSVDFETITAFQTDNETYCMSHVKSYASDNYFGMLADGYNHAKQASQPTQVAVGRVSARMVSQARDFNEKARRWFASLPTPGEYSSVVLVSGTLNQNRHVEHTLEVQRNMASIKPDFVFTQVPARVIPYSYDGEMTVHHNVMLEALRRGAGYFSYSGHGSIYFIDNNTLMSTRTVTSEEYDCPPFVMLSSCAQFCFDKLGSSLLESMILYPRGGAIAGVAACRDVYLNYNQYTCLSVAQAYASAKPGATVGDIYLDARRRVLERIPESSLPDYEPAELLNNMSYNLAGDPAMPLCIPSLTACVTSSTEVEPLKETVIEGEIHGTDGNIDTSFDGKVRITVYDGVHTEKTLPMSDGGPDFVPLNLDMENDVLGIAEGNVTAGRFTARLTVPDPFYRADTYRALISATRADTPGDGAVGTARLTILPLPGGATTSPKAPQILNMYASAPGFTSGDEVGPTFTLYAEVDPGESGINYATAGITARTQLLVDGTNAYSGLEGHFSRRDDGTLLLAIPMVGMSDGYHNIDLTVANNAGLVTRATIDVMTVDRTLTAAVTVDEEAPDDYVEISLDNCDTEVHNLYITDTDGRTVFNARQPVLPLRWNLTTNGGEKLPDGEYTVHMLLHDGTGYGQATPARVVILR